MLKYNNICVAKDFWASNTDGKPCWHCCHPFSGQIFSYPVRYDTSLKIWTVEGRFCSLNCKKKYIIVNKYINTSCIGLNTLMDRLVYGVTDDVVPAPPRSQLELFCIVKGSGQHIDEFRKQCKDNMFVTIVHHPVYPFKFENKIVAVADQKIISTNPDLSIVKHFTQQTYSRSDAKDHKHDHQTPLKQKLKKQNLSSYFKEDIILDVDMDADKEYESPVE